MAYVGPAPPWEVGRQGVLNSAGARVPEHAFGHPVPLTCGYIGGDEGT
jgi:hypothetical protein